MDWVCPLLSLQNHSENGYPPKNTPTHPASLQLVVWVCGLSSLKKSKGFKSPLIGLGHFDDLKACATARQSTYLELPPGHGSADIPCCQHGQRAAGLATSCVIGHFPLQPTNSGVPSPSQPPTRPAPSFSRRAERVGPRAPVKNLDRARNLEPRSMRAALGPLGTPLESPPGTAGRRKKIAKRVRTHKKRLEKKPKKQRSKKARHKSKQDDK